MSLSLIFQRPAHQGEGVVVIIWRSMLFLGQWCAQPTACAGWCCGAGGEGVRRNWFAWSTGLDCQMGLFQSAWFAGAQCWLMTCVVWGVAIDLMCVRERSAYAKCLCVVGPTSGSISATKTSNSGNNRTVKRVPWSHWQIVMNNTLQIGCYIWIFLAFSCSFLGTACTVLRPVYYKAVGWSFW